MKCPYCNEDLDEWEDRFYCTNMLCPASGEDLPKFLWQALIDGKKAQDALGRAISWLETISIVEMGCATSNTAAKEALDEITSITKQIE